MRGAKVRFRLHAAQVMAFREAKRSCPVAWRLVSLPCTQRPTPTFHPMPYTLHGIFKALPPSHPPHLAPTVGPRAPNLAMSLRRRMIAAHLDVPDTVSTEPACPLALRVLESDTVWILKPRQFKELLLRAGVYVTNSLSMQVPRRGSKTSLPSVVPCLRINPLKGAR